MQSTHTLTTTEHQDTLSDALLVMLEEASSRHSAAEAALVIQGVLDSLSKDHERLSPLAARWHHITVK